MSERFIPDFKDTSYYEHYHRYLISNKFIEDSIVLDIASGEGYGSYLLSEKAKKVVSVDLDISTIQLAKQKYKKDNLEFHTGDINQLSFDNDTFDVVICLETIEHVPHPDKALHELTRVLKPDGILIISTPNKAVYTDEKKFYNPHHIKEFYFTEFNNKLLQYFQIVDIYGQRMIRGSNVWGLSEERNGLEMLNSGISLPMYYIALCTNNKELKLDIKNSFFTDEFVDNEINRARNSIIELEQQINNARNTINSLVSEIDIARENYNQKELELKNARETISTSGREIDRARQIHDQKEFEINNARDTINSLVTEIEVARDTINGLVHETSIAEERYDHAIFENLKITEAYNEIKNANEIVVGELADIKKSFLFKVKKFFYK